MKLKDLTHGPKKNRFCGPAVISFITGLTTGEAAALIRTQSNRNRVLGTYTIEVSRALRACGYTLVRKHRGGRKADQPTLARWLSDNKDLRTSGRVYLIVAGNHWQLVTGQRYACGRVGEIVSVRDKRVKRRARVEEVYEVVEMVEGAERKSVSRRKTREVREMLAKSEKQARRTYSATASTSRKVRRIAEKHDISVEVDDWGGGSKSIYTFPPQWVYDHDLIDEEEYCTASYSWEEALANIERMAAYLSTLEKPRLEPVSA